MLTHSLVVNYRDLPVLVHSDSALGKAFCGIEISRSLVNDFVKVNYDNSLAECLNRKLILMHSK